MKSLGHFSFRPLPLSLAVQVAFLAVILFCGSAFGQVGVATTLSTETDFTTDTTTTGVKVTPSSRGDHWSFWVQATEDSAGLLDITIQHSPDCTNYADLISFAQVSSTGYYQVLLPSATAKPFVCLRAVLDVTGGQWDVDLKAYSD